jgi:hypothetical protein
MPTRRNSKLKVAKALQKKYEEVFISDDEVWSIPNNKLQFYWEIFTSLPSLKLLCNCIEATIVIKMIFPSVKVESKFKLA